MLKHYMCAWHVKYLDNFAVNDGKISNSGVSAMIFKTCLKLMLHFHNKNISEKN